MSQHGCLAQRFEARRHREFPIEAPFKNRETPAAVGQQRPDSQVAESGRSMVLSSDSGHSPIALANVCAGAMTGAAARVPLLGVEGVRDRLDERFRLLTAGSRLALRRYQTLRAALEWSCRLLSEPEQRIFDGLGVFVGGFSLESAQNLATDANIDEWVVLALLRSSVTEYKYISICP
jgi:hypothetical protein